MISGSIDSIESLGLYDGPGIRVVVFMNGCKLRCKYCHNPEMWLMRDKNITSDELVKKILRFQSYISDGGGVTFSGGEPLLQPNFLIDCCKKLKEHNVHVALDTAGVGIGKYEEILSYIDLIIFDVDSNLKEIANAMKRYDVGIIILSKKKKIKGIITDRDIVTKILANQDNKIKEYMTTNLISIDINSDINEAINLMKKHKIKRLLVKDNNKLVGILSLSDLFNVVDNETLIEVYKTIFSINRNTDKYLTDINEFEL